MTKAYKHLEDIYLDWYNNYIGYDVFAEQNSLTIEEAKDLINISRAVYVRKNVPY